MAIYITAVHIDTPGIQQFAEHFMTIMPYERRQAVKSIRQPKAALQSVMGQALLADCLSTKYDLVYRKLQFSKGPHGKPMLSGHPDIHFNISHSDGWVVCAAGCAKVGIDIEKIHHLKADIAKKCLSPREQADLAAADDPESYLFRLWVLKECYCKYTGEGLFMPFKSASFDIAEDSQIHCGAAPRLLFKEYDIDPLYKMAACSAAGLPKDVHIVSLPEICASLRLSEPAI